MSDQVTVFICGDDKKGLVKVQLELHKDVFEAIKVRAKEFQGGKFTPKQLMENVLRNWIDGVVESE